ncbi:hypothetical protein [Actinosynnema pretiosum]|uniref:Uncharacterized protein n=1 Tax=Actinosynnema pretiosum TaxID=42197 RepID=A0A290ZF20_9PSEU|nr:hypothetical protein [Actinosynnema pretiosum]ATE57640.1 hypothetical protein CNX65_33630 [Actinosynnema pretiosum]
MTNAVEKHDSAEDGSTSGPLFGRAEFAVLLDELVTDYAPRVFAVTQTWGDCLDGWIVGWGMAFGDHAEVFSVEGRVRTRVSKPENALRYFGADEDVTTRLVWLHSTGTRASDQEPKPAQGYL